MATSSIYSSALWRRAATVSSTFVSASFLRRRIPIVGAVCILSLALCNLFPLLHTSSAQSLTSVPLFKSKSIRQSQYKSFHSIRMEGNTDTVPGIVVYVTVPNKEAGMKLAESIVKERLAACVNRVPGIESVYEWKGEIQTDSEELLIIKTRESLLELLTEHVKANHEYDVPEVISLPITGGNRQYLEWLVNSTRGEAAS